MSVNLNSTIIAHKSISPKIVMFTGGSGSRTLSISLKKLNPNTYHIINTADSGRSTREIRKLFNIPAVGDIRSRLIDLSDDSENKEVLDLLRYRFPSSSSATEGILEDELHQIINNEHSLVKKILENSPCSSELVKIITKNIGFFQLKRIEYENRLKTTFNLSEASIGNLFLTGAYLFYQDLEAPIFLYKKLANVKGDVIPATLDNIHLAAEMQNGLVLEGQHKITKSEFGPPKRIWFLDEEKVDAHRVEPKVNPKVIKTIESLSSTDIISYCMGSFYTSILSTLKITGIAEAIRKSPAKKLFLANPTEDEETKGMTVGSMAYELLKVLKEQDSLPGKDTDYLQYVITHNITEPNISFGNRYIIPAISDPIKSDIRFIKTNDILITPEQNVQQAGLYNPEKLAHLLNNF